MRFNVSNPFEFFKKIASLKESIAILLISATVFVAFNEISIRTGFTKYMPKAGPVQSIISNFIAILAGFLIISVFLYIMFRLCKKKISIKSVVFVVAYSFMPLLLVGWIPMGFVTAIAALLSFFYLLIGASVVASISYKKSFIIALIEFCILAALVIAVNILFVK